MKKKKEREDLLATSGVGSGEKTSGIGVGNNEKERRF